MEKVEIKNKITKIIVNLNRITIDLSKDIIVQRDNIDAKEITNILDDTDNHSYIYVIICNLIASKNEVSKKIDKLKQDEKLCISKINEKHWERTNTKEDVCLYVGSSKEIKKRINQHLNEGYKNTYSLKLKKLNEDNKFFKNIKVNLLLFKIEDYELVKYFEAKLWDELKPLFGQKCNK